MIKNILYSLFLHLTLAGLVYAGFHKIQPEELLEIENGISIGMIEIAKNDKPQIAAPIVEKKKEEKKPIKKPQKKKPKKVEEKKPIKPTNPNIVEEKKEYTKTEEVKKEEIIEEKKEEKIAEITKEEVIVEEKIENQDSSKIYENTEVIDQLEDLNLTAREKFNIQSQLNGCFYRVLKDKNLDEKEKTDFEIKVRLLVDGTILFNREENIDQKRYENPAEKKYREIVDNVVLAIELCSPFRNLTAEKYDIWREFRIKFKN